MARIMIVEDEVILAMDIEEKLKARSYEVCGIASHGQEAIEMVRQHKPDLLLMDICIKGPMDGIETVARLREFSDAPIIYLTAYANDETLNRAKATEPYGYVVKPYRTESLYAAVEVALHKHRMVRMRREDDEWFRKTLKDIRSAVLIVDQEHKIAFMNPAAQKLLEFDEKEASDRPFEEVIGNFRHEESGASLDEFVNRLLTGPSDSATDNVLECMLVNRTGKQFPVLLSHSKLENNYGRIFNVFILMTDVLEIRQRQQRLKKDLAVFEKLSQMALAKDKKIETLESRIKQLEAQIERSGERQKA